MAIFFFFFTELFLCHCNANPRTHVGDELYGYCTVIVRLLCGAQGE